jgi:hypothetical protein
VTSLGDFSSGDFSLCSSFFKFQKNTILLHGEGFALSKNEFGYILGYFFTNLSGHPDRHKRQNIKKPYM